ncbi:T9SS type A sorting domain-containing protein [Chryseobacterium sp. CT-SW4]|uniref:T9SS type A sorting domain-containing protein n=1 Tax=Chryseobacterium sp. SW-1 TaxID=3157343 RepID=UPI003B01AC58
MNNFSKPLFRLFSLKMQFYSNLQNYFQCIIVFILLGSASIKAQNPTTNSNGSTQFIIDDIYQSQQGPNIVKSFYYKFSANSKHYALILNGRLTMAMLDQELYISTRDMISNTPQQGNILNTYAPSPNTANIYFIYEIVSEEMVSAQIVETDSDENYITSSPIYTMTTHSFNDTTDENILKIDNVDDNNSLMVQQMAYYTHPEVSRDERDIQFSQLECLIPVLSIANQFLSRPCDLVKSSLNYISGDNNSGTSNNNSFNPQITELSWDLTDYILSGEKNAYSGYAASQTCELPLQTVFSTRKPRSPEGIDCLYDVTEILTPYLRLTNYDFNYSHFQTVVNNILSNGNTGLRTAENANIDDELINAVNTVTIEANLTTIDYMVQLQEAANLYGSTIAFQTTVAESINPGPSTSQASTSEPLSTAIGNYELRLAGMSVNQFRQTYPEVAPRTYTNDQWSTSSTPFISYVVANPNAQQIQEVINILHGWYPPSLNLPFDVQSERPTTISEEAAIASETLLAMGEGLSYSLIESLQSNNPNNVIIFVYHQDRPVSFLLGNVNTESRIASISYSVSNPDNLRVPYSNTAVRGSGQYALQQYIEYCINNNINVINSFVVTEVSARVKRKFGFIHEDDEPGGAAGSFMRMNINNANEIMIAENPISGNEIKFVGDIKNIKNIVVSDARGNIVFRRSNPFTNTNSISIKDINPGIYFINMDGKTYKVLKR